VSANVLNERVRLETHNHVALVLLDRPDKFNAVDTAMIDGLVAAATAITEDPEVRAVVLAGSGKHFCAGIDLTVFDQGEAVLGPEMMGSQPGTDANYFQQPALVWRELPVPVIAAVHGICYGAGLQIALGADIRVAAPESSLSVMEIKWGIIPDMGISVTARGLLRPDRLKELAMTGRVVSGEEALELGLVTEVADAPADRAQAIATTIAGRSPDAVTAIKSLLNTAPDLPRAEALRLEAELQLGLLGRPNQAEAMQANLEKRAPEFAPRQRR
jgi:enoyl-CoA hydratase/carnithine racemase